MKELELIKLIIELQEKHNSIVTAIKVDESGDVYYQLKEDEKEFNYIEWRTLYYYNR